MFKVKTHWINVVGVIIGFVGAIGLLMVGKSENLNNNFLFVFYIILATICYALSVNVIKRHLGDVNAISATVWAMMFIGPFAGIYLFTTDFTQRLQTTPVALQSLGYISILGVLGTAVSVIVFNVLIIHFSQMLLKTLVFYQ